MALCDAILNFTRETKKKHTKVHNTRETFNSGNETDSISDGRRVSIHKNERHLERNGTNRLSSINYRQLLPFV